MLAKGKTYGVIQLMDREDIQFERNRLKSKKFDIDGKVVLITGASSGIGQATAKAFAKKGAKLVLVARNKKKLAATLDSILPDAPGSFFIDIDITREKAAEAIIKTVWHKTKDEVDLLINSAGRGVLGNVENVPVAAYRQALELNFFAPVALIKAVLPGMKKKSNGQIINITSGVASRGLPGVSPYCASKSAFLRFSESLRVESMKAGVDVIDFSPGLVNSNFEKNLTVFGNLKNTFTKGKTLQLNLVAERIVKASYYRERSVCMSRRARMVSIVDFISPKITDVILRSRS